LLRSIVEKYMSLTPGVGVIVYDPMTLMAGTMAATAAGTALSAGGTIAGGKAANTSAQFTAAQLEQNAAGAVASGQRSMFDTQAKTRSAMSTATARAAGGGVNAGVGSPAADVGQIAKRGSYLAAMDLFRGENTATGLENQASGVLYSGQAAEEGADLSAAGTIAGGAGSMMQQYGRFAYPQLYGRMS
jgi:hypothetical protein